MQPVTRQQIFTLAAKKLRSDFEELSVVPHAQLKGGQAEALVKAFLRSHLPKRFAVGSGFIIDAKDQISKQTDVIIYDALNCPIYRTSEEAAIIPADNVAAVIEVKSNLDKERLKEASENCKAVKALAKTRSADTPGLSLSQTFFAVFAFNTSLSAATISDHYGAMTAESGLGRHIDLILVLDKSISNLSIKMPGMSNWVPAFFAGIPPNAEGTHISTATMPLGASSLDGFLRMLLPQLMHFREITGHPGFNWQQMNPDAEARLSYLTSITMETDPARRRSKQEQYAAEITAEFDAKNKADADAGKNR